MWKCKKCNEYRFSTAKECHCKQFIVTCEDGEDHEVQAMDEEGAALKYAEDSNVGNDYYLMNEEVTIKVNGVDYVIGAEPDVYYSANKCD